jgi:hypothetical protein
VSFLGKYHQDCHIFVWLVGRVSFLSAGFYSPNGVHAFPHLHVHHGHIRLHLGAHGGAFPAPQLQCVICNLRSTALWSHRSRTHTPFALISRFSLGKRPWLVRSTISTGLLQTYYLRCRSLAKLTTSRSRRHNDIVVWSCLC